MSCYPYTWCAAACIQWKMGGFT